MTPENPALTEPMELRRRWFLDDYFDLFVWYDTDEEVHSFQLCYDKRNREGVVTWIRSGSLTHSRIGSGEQSPKANRSPMLVPDDEFPASMVQREFEARSTTLPEKLRELILQQIQIYENRPR